MRTELLNWLDGFGDDIQFVSDVCHYDMVLLCELISDGAMLLPEYINPFCHDLCQDISMILDISEKAALTFRENSSLQTEELICRKAKTQCTLRCGSYQSDI